MKIEHRIRQVSYTNKVLFKTRCRNSRDAQRILAQMGCHGDASMCAQDRGFVHRTWSHKLWQVEYITEIK